MASVLIVDDCEANRAALRRALSAQGHRVVEANGGKAALAMARSETIDLAVVDFMMPELDGIETGVQLKQQSGHDFFPVIIVTGHDNQALRNRGLGIVDDFIARPFDVEELRARVANLLRVREREVALRAQAFQVEELSRFRDEMLSLLVHDMKNGLSVVVANLQFAAESLPMDCEARSAMGEAGLASKRVLRHVNNLLDLSRLETAGLVARRATLTSRALIEPLIAQRRFIADARVLGVVLEGDLDHEIEVDADLLSRVVENLLDNAFRYTPQNGRIVVAAQSQPSGILLTVGNNGPPIPVEMRERIFEKFGQVTPQVGRMNFGLGLYFCRLAVAAHGGRLWVEEREALPTVFCISVPHPK